MKRRLCFIIFSFIVTVAAVADTGRLITPDRMSSSLITCICQDARGFIWVGTEYGLNKFDGYRFITYTHHEADTTSIADNEVSTLFVDGDGALWVGCAKGLVRYDYERDAFTQYHFPDDREPRVNSLLQAADGRLLIGTAGYGLYSVRRGMQHIDYEGNYNRRRIDVFYSRMHLDRQGNLWRSSHVDTFTRSTIKEQGARGKEQGARGKEPSPTLRDYQSTCGQPMDFIEYGEDRLLIVCMYGILSYSYRTGEVEPADFDLSALSRNVSVRRACLDSKGNLYVATTGSGLMMIPAGEKKLVDATPQQQPADFDLATADIVGVMEDKDHHLWAACYGRGLLMISKRIDAFQTWSFADQNYRTGGNVCSITEGDDGHVWCTVQNNGVFRFDRAGRIAAHPQSPEGTRLIFHDRHGRYWLCTQNVLYRYDPLTGRSQAVQTFNGRGLNCITDDAEGRLYISDYGLGLYIYDPMSGQGETVSMQQTQRPGGYLCNDWIKSLLFDSHGQLWIGTVHGTSVMNPAERSFNRHGWNVLLEGHQCFSLCETADGNMLIGTDDGLYAYDRQQNRVSEVAGCEALHDKLIGGMTRDAQGDIWISTSHGIWQYKKPQTSNLKPQTSNLIGYINGNGLGSHEYVQGVMLHRADDRIFLGTAEGITTFSPQDVNVGHLKLGPVYLTRMTVNGHAVNPDQQHFMLRHDENNITLDFSQLDFQNVGNIAFQYRINGHKAWQQTNEGENQITFTQLQPGDYTLEVRATDNGISSEQTLTLTFSVAKPWYRTWWAYLCYGAIVGGFVLLLLYNFERQRRRDLEETKMRFLINATHDIRSPLTLIMAAVEKLKQAAQSPQTSNLKSQTSALHPQPSALLPSIDSIDRNAQRLLLLVNQILDERKIDKQQMRLHCTETDLVQFVKGVCNLYEYNAQQRNITFTYEHPEQPVKVWIDRTQFDKVVSNLLSNAFKYTFDGGEIKVVLTQSSNLKSQTSNLKSQSSNHALLQVIDSGLGFEDDKTERFFERFYQGKNSKDLHIDGTGIGLNLCRALTQMHGGTISAANRKDGQRGAVLTVELPLGNSHLKPEQIEEQGAGSKGQGARSKEQGAGSKGQGARSKEQGAGDKEQGAGSKKQASRNLHLLVVDDDVEIGRYIATELADWYKFDYASNGREGLKMLLTKHYDLVVSDVMMPEMDGITMLRSIKQNPNISDIPVILLTSKSEVEYRLEGLKKGADAFLAKPFALEELHILIDNLVDNVRRLRGKFSGEQEQQQRMEQVKVKGNNDALMDRIMKSVNKNLSNPDFDVETLTKDVGISRAQLHRKMKEITGIPTSEFIRNLRLEQAARLIREKKINITQVAYSVGFNNQTHFSTVFKKHFGMTPTEYAEGGDR